jgi:hypothetical protein
VISSLEHNLARIVFQTGPLDQSLQGLAGPFGIADSAQLPLRSPNLGEKKDPTVARALQSRDPRLGWHLAQFLVAQGQRVPDRTVNPEPIIAGVETRSREMAPYIVKLRSNGISKLEGVMYFWVGRS